MNQSVEEALSEYPREIVKFFESDIKLEGWNVEKKLGGYLPSLFQQLANKLKKEENETVYEVIFTFKKNEE